MHFSRNWSRSLCCLGLLLLIAFHYIKTNLYACEINIGTVDVSTQVNQVAGSALENNGQNYLCSLTTQ